MNFQPEAIIEAAIAAGKLIMKYFGNHHDIEIKIDDSPVTKADIAADEYIAARLQSISNLQIVSEENIPANFTPTEPFWLVDPLDGTKSFIKGGSDFTVNIALMLNLRPVFGVVYAPAIDELYYNIDSSAYFNHQKISVTKPDNLRVVASRSHLDEATKNYIENHQLTDVKNIGSSLKFCLIAKGEADIYPRFAPTMEWDIAAGDAILQAVGGNIYDLKGEKIQYGKKDFLNPNFIAVSKFVDYNEYILKI